MPLNLFSKKTFLFLAFAVLAWGCSSPPEDISSASFPAAGSRTFSPEDLSREEVPEIFFEFEGYGPGKSHKGIFEDIEAFFLADTGGIKGFEAVIRSGSVNTPVSLLNEHLRGESFFNSGRYPEIRFKTFTLEEGPGGIVFTGNLFFRGIERDISFPAEAGPESVSAEFMLDISLFGIKYAGVNDSVRIMFRLSGRS